MMSLSDDEQADVIDALNTTSRYLDDILNINTVLHTVQINFHAVDVNKYRYIQTPIGLLIF